MSTRILVGDVRERLAELPADSVHCVVTSVPYWGLRSYDTPPQVWGGDFACHHDFTAPIRSKKRGSTPGTSTLEGHRDGQTLRKNEAAEAGHGQHCRHCGAWLGEHGQEPLPDLWLAHEIEIWRAVRRVLRPDGVAWLNVGDSYACSVNGRSAAETKARGADDRTFRDKPFSTAVGGIKDKDLCLLPERLALGLQADGWWIRARLPWLKRNGMPDSTEDRPGASVEYVFLLSRSRRYDYDHLAVRLAPAPDTTARYERARSDDHKHADGGPGEQTIARSFEHMRRRKTDKQRGHSRRHAGFNDRWDQMSRAEQQANGRNFRNVDLFYESLTGPHGLITDDEGDPLALDVTVRGYPGAHFATFPPKLIEPLIKAGCPEGGTVLDPFGGAGTTGLVANRLGREAILIELNADYAEIARRRIEDDAPMFAAVQVDGEGRAEV